MVSVNVTPQITPPAPTICAGESVTLDAGAGYQSYLWSTGETSETITVSPAATTTYNVTVTNTSGCQGSSSAVVTVNATPAPTILAPTSALCEGGATTLDAGAGYQSYAWSTGETTQSINVQPAASTTYSVTVTSIAGCSGKASKTITVNANPLPVISAASTTVCAGTATTLDAGPGYASYLWSTGELTQIITVAPAATTTYTVFVANGGGCQASAEVTVNVDALPPAEAGPNWEICPGGSVQLGSPATPGFNYRWFPDAGLDDPTVAQPNASPSDTTIYTLIVSDATTGCSRADTATVQVAAGAPPVAMGNVLKETKATLGQDVLHHWAESPGATSYDLDWSPARDMSGAAQVASIPTGPAGYLEPSAIHDGVTLRYYHIGGNNCTPIMNP